MSTETLGKYFRNLTRDQEYVECFNGWMKWLNGKMDQMALDLAALKSSSDRAVAKITELETKVTALTAQLADTSGEAAAQAEINAIAANLATAAPAPVEPVPPAPAP